jgi:hypothetical protein
LSTITRLQTHNISSQNRHQPDDPYIWIILIRPPGFPRPSELINRERSSFGERKRFVVDPELHPALREVCANEGCANEGCANEDRWRILRVGDCLRGRSAGCFEWLPPIKSRISTAGGSRGLSVDQAEGERPSLGFGVGKHLARFGVSVV